MVLQAVERERKLLIDMIWSMGRYFDTGKDEYLQLCRARGGEWVVEWRCVKGELKEEIERDGKRVKLPSISEEERKEVCSRRMENPTDVKELVCIEDVPCSLEVPGDLTAQSLGEWL